MKECRRCKTVKPLSEYSPKQYSRDGLRKECKPCVVVINREYRQAKRLRLAAKTTKPMDYKDYLQQQNLYDYYKRTLKYQ